jgi:hypothetical protein
MTRKRRSFARPVPDFGAPFKCGTSRHMVRWCERPGAYMRGLGFAHDVIRAETGRRPDGEGYYIDSDFDEIVRGVVFRLPGGRGFVAGVADPHNDGPAMVAVCEAPEDSALEAARLADHLAECYAEAVREYQESWRAGQKAGDAWRETMQAAGDSLAYARSHLTEARDAARLALALRGAAEVPPDILAGALAGYRDSLKAAREALAGCCEARREAWRRFRNAVPDYDRDARAAFMEGAGL